MQRYCWMLNNSQRQGLPAWIRLTKTSLKGIKNLFDIYLPIVDGALIFDNSEGKHELTAEKQGDRLLNILNQDKFDYLRRYCDTIEIQIDEKNKILKGLEKV